MIYSDPKVYPPTIHAANILCEMGWTVYLIGVKYPSAPENIFIDTRVKMVYRGSQSTGIQNKLDYFLFIIFLNWFTLTRGIRFLIAYDAMAVLPVYLSTSFTSKKWFYHQHDYFDKGNSFFQRLAVRFEKKISKNAAFTIFPQVQRADIFARENGLCKTPLIVFNGPRKSWAYDNQPINKQIIELRKKFSFLLVYQGGWSKYFGIENLIKAISHVRSDVAVVMMGKELEVGIKEYYLRLSEEQKVKERFLFLDHVPYDLLPSVTRYCDIGIAKLTNDNDKAPLNDRFVIGASNKVTEYIACGLPVITCKSEPNQHFFSQFPVGVMCDVEDPVKFAAAIDELLCNKDRMSAFKITNKEIFLATLNYDDQFKKVCKELEKMYL